MPTTSASRPQLPTRRASSCAGPRPDGCSGTVHVEPLHNIAENTATWNVAGGWMVRQGHVWIGVTTSAGTFAEAGSAMSGGVTHLKHVDPDRYGGLSLLALADPPPSWPGAARVDMDALRRDLAVATAHGVGAPPASSRRSGRPTRPLAAFPVERLHASGWSQTGDLWSSCNGATTRRWLDGCATARPSTAS